jgi:galactokinase
MYARGANDVGISMLLPIVPAGDQEQLLFHLKRRFIEQFGEGTNQPYFLVTVPLRVCPLGAHSDHQGGLVSGFTIDRSIQLLACFAEAPGASVYSEQSTSRRDIDFATVPEKLPGDWGNYLCGAIEALGREKGRLSRGFCGVVHGAMPIGGLSSSAAVTIAYLKALEYVNGISLSNLEIILLVRAVENGYLGLHSGILDQSVIVSGCKDALVCTDCTSQTVHTVAIGSAAEPWEVLVVYSGLSRQLTATPFNQRVAECHEAARMLLECAKKPFSAKPLLGEVDEELFEQYKEQIPDALRRRARHFFSERSRVRRGVDFWAQGNVAAFGELVTASGRSSIVNYEAGSEALISLYEILAQISGVYGARFCGGGFQGCCLAIVDPRRREQIAQALHEAYIERHPELANDYSIHFCSSANAPSVMVVE